MLIAELMKINQENKKEIKEIRDELNIQGQKLDYVVNYVKDQDIY